VAQGAAIGPQALVAARGAAYWYAGWYEGITDGTVAASGAKTDDVGPHIGPRSNHGHNRRQQQPVRLAANIATASKVRIFFMALNLLGKQRGDYCLGRVV
jgi:hypothetical protein